MKIRMEDGLPLVEITIKYKDKEKILKNVLLDTGSSNTIFDTDAVEDIDLVIDPIKGKARRMYGVGGESELCYEQTVSDLTIEEFILRDFTVQLGITRENYGFDAILGVDFMYKNGIMIDFKNLAVNK
ncbi:retropepsin-like aspartic protease [Crassaminicella profunda]|uniref:retropepsin-like aspartic protease n=1 Tax=Crassaminicella profunda TaxID=1286698 RepID=UPI001CA6D4F8|nr:retropepsin-like aspartic protease [Crassaminicella profunda]QZY54396.1 retropepsin-like domain-containing protein [Crassaminicella profunda]